MRTFLTIGFSCFGIQQRFPFTVFAHHTVVNESRLLSEVRWHSNSKGEEEQDPHDDEPEDPLEGDCPDEELVYRQGYSSVSAISFEHESTPLIRTSSEYAHVEPHGVVLEHDQEEHAIQQERPDEHVRNDPCRQAVRAHHGSPAPEQRDVIPGQWSRNHGYVDLVRSGRVTEVDRRQVEEVEHKHELRRPEVAADPEE